MKASGGRPAEPGRLLAMPPLHAIVRLAAPTTLVMAVSAISNVVYTYFVRDFNFERGRTYELAAAHADLEAYAKVHPALQKPLDLAGWLYFLSGHVERHTLQIEEVKATAGFPKG